MELTINGDIDDIIASMSSFLDKVKASTPLTPTGLIAELAQVDLQSLLVTLEGRLDAEGYEIVKKKPLLADRKKEEARAKLRGDLTASVAVGETEAEAPEGGSTPLPVQPKKAKGNGSGKVDGKVLKDKCLAKLKAMYDSGRKAEVNKLLADHGNGAKNFQQVPEENFVAIHDALQGVD